MGSISDPYGAPIDAASNNAATGKIAVANLFEGSGAGSVSVCTLAGGCKTNLTNSNMYEVAGVAMSRNGDCWADATNSTGTATLTFFKNCNGSGRAATGFVNPYYGGLDIDAGGDLVTISAFTPAIYVYKGCNPACSLVGGPFQMEGPAVFGHLNKTSTRLAAANYEFNRVDISNSVRLTCSTTTVLTTVYTGARVLPTLPTARAKSRRCAGRAHKVHFAAGAAAILLKRYVCSLGRLLWACPRNLFRMRRHKRKRRHGVDRCFAQRNESHACTLVDEARRRQKRPLVRERRPVFGVCADVSEGWISSAGSTVGNRRWRDGSDANGNVYITNFGLPGGSKGPLFIFKYAHGARLQSTRSTTATTFRRLFRRPNDGQPRRRKLERFARGAAWRSTRMAEASRHFWVWAAGFTTARTTTEATSF